MAKNRLWILLLCGALALYALLDVLGKSRIAVRTYPLKSEKLSGRVRIMLITDLHSGRYGQNQRTLLSLIRAQAPDLVLFGGDMAHHKGPDGNAMLLMTTLAGEYPCYYVTGNHELSTARVSEMKSALRDAGVTMLAGDCVTAAASNGQRVQLCGVDEFYRYSGKKQSEWQRSLAGAIPPALTRQLKSASAKLDDALFSVLLVHRPEKFEWYLPYGFDLILSGHTHGGQVRIPGVLNGLYAPGQGLFPAYAGGEYDFSAQTLIVSRGLSKKPFWAARICNPPELVVVDLVPA